MDEISDNNLYLLFIFPNEKEDFDKFGVSYQFENMNSYICFDLLNQRKNNIFIGKIGDNFDNKLISELFGEKIILPLNMNKCILKITFLNNILNFENSELIKGIILLEGYYPNELNDFSKSIKEFIESFIKNISDIILYFNSSIDNSINGKQFLIKNEGIILPDYLNKLFEYKYENKNQCDLYYYNNNDINIHTIKFFQENIYTLDLINKEENNIINLFKTSLIKYFNFEKIFSFGNHIYISRNKINV